MPRISSLRGAIKRGKIRRLYNNQEYEAAINLAKQETESDVNGAFAQDIIVRGLWNLGEYEEILDFVLVYKNADLQGLAEKARKIIDPLSLETPPPMELAELGWNEGDLLANWYQVESRLWLRHPRGWVYWDMPKEFPLATVHPNILALAIEVLLHPIVPEAAEIVVDKRPFGSQIGLSFSGGIDSTAAAMLLPDTALLAYHKRSFQSMIDHRLAENLFKEMKINHGREVFQVPSNHELLRTTWGKPVGFSTDFAAAVHLILLADVLDLGTIALGTPIDNTWLAKGKKFRQFSESDYWKKWSARFSQAGLRLEFPINHISEAGALRICQQSPLLCHINSCLRGDGEHWCGTCWKCFHKNGPLGREFDFQSNEIQSFLSMKPLRTAQHALWAIQSMGLEDRVPHLKGYLNQPLEWWESFYPPGLDLINESLRSFVEKRTREYLKPMSQPYQLELVELDL